MKLLMHYAKPAEDTEYGWEHDSLPIGCGWLGGNVFGGIRQEHLQITNNEAWISDGPEGRGLTSFADIYVDFAWEDAEVTDYRRGLDLDNALAFVQYKHAQNHIECEYFASYPDRCIAGRIRTSESSSYRFALSIPYLSEEKGTEKHGTVTAEGNTLTMTGVLGGYNLRFCGQLRIFTNGTLAAGDGISVSDATETTFIFCAATNYELRSEIFTEQDDRKKLRDFDPAPQLHEMIEQAVSHPYESLKQRHMKDYTALFGRVSLDLGETAVPEKPTDELLADYPEHPSRYLEVLYFQYGRYLLISSSRSGTQPANLQGTWNMHQRAPWSGGYWHDINIQMNYWPAFSTNIAETFDAYAAYNLAVRDAAQSIASEYIRQHIPENYDETPGSCGWALGTAATPYSVSMVGGHTGPGVGGLTSKMFWEYYSFTGDLRILRDTVYPAIRDMMVFLMKSTRNYDGKQLAAFSASPEQTILLGWNSQFPYYHTVGCAFDQQMIYENACDLLRCAEILGEETLSGQDRALISLVREQIAQYDPIQVGWSGQIKEYREERWYGEIGEWCHRHISQLVALHPGCTINKETAAWLDAAKVSLDFRSDHSTGWALAHRLNAWARTGDGNRAHRLYANLIGTRTMANLWDAHPPFQIDGNFGGTSGAAEMLLQSHGRYIEPLAALPDVWSDGCYTGLAARGGFVFDVRWKNGCAEEMTIHARNSGICRIHYRGIGDAAAAFAVTVIDDDHIEFFASAGTDYRITAIPAFEKKPVPTALQAAGSAVMHLTWTFAEPVHIWRAVDSAPQYTRIASSVMGGVYDDTAFDFRQAETVTYKITRADTDNPADPGAVTTRNHSTALQRQRYRYLIHQLGLNAGGVKVPEDLGAAEPTEK